MTAPQVLTVLDTEVLVASRSQPGVAWRVRRSHAGAHVCPCPATTRRCAHVDAAAATLDDLWVTAGPGPARGCGDLAAHDDVSVPA